MNKQEMTERFEGLYDYMATSRKPKYMKHFGMVMKDMMAWFIENKPEAAEMYLDTLSSIEWEQYLTRNEAMEIVKNMQPKAAWDYDPWHSAMKSLGLECEREHVFNSYALWVVMNAVHSDNGAVLTSLMGIAPTDTGNADYIRAVHSMALNLLLDEDGKYCVRCYFLGSH